MLGIALFSLLSFLQATVINLDLILLVLICRSLLMEDDKNYYLAFGVGLLFGFLTIQPLGLLSIFYLLVVFLIYLLKRTTLGTYWPVVIPLVIIFATIEQFLRKIFFDSFVNFIPVIILTMLALPTYLLIRFWEERFIPRKDLKLKLGK